jgi:hypothetical protein
MEPGTAFILDTAFWTLGIVVSYACFTASFWHNVPSIAETPRNVKFYVSKPHKLEPRRPEISHESSMPERDPADEDNMPTNEEVPPSFFIHKPNRIKKEYKEGKWVTVVGENKESEVSAGLRTAWSTAPTLNWPTSRSTRVNTARVRAEVHSQMDGLTAVEFVRELEKLEPRRIKTGVSTGEAILPQKTRINNQPKQFNSNDFGIQIVKSDSESEEFSKKEFFSRKPRHKEGGWLAGRKGEESLPLGVAPARSSATRLTSPTFPLENRVRVEVHGEMDGLPQVE